jgi:hypothetical protein
MSAAPVPTARSTVKTPPPPLQNGDRLSRAEFERRYAVDRDVKKAELIEGVVFMASPVGHRSHSKPHLQLGSWLAYYVAKTSAALEYGDNGTTRLDGKNVAQPDLFLLLPTHLGGKAKIDEDDYISGPPALICEIAASTVSIDLHHKKTAYARSGVAEYVVWRVEDQAVDWFTLAGGEYATQSPAVDGVLKSTQFPGLWLDVPALLRGDLPSLFATIDRGVATAEHAEFVRRLKA